MNLNTPTNKETAPDDECKLTSDMADLLVSKMPFDLADLLGPSDGSRIVTIKDPYLWGLYIKNHCVADFVNHCAKTGSLDTLKWARNKEYPWGEDTCAYAAEGGHFELLKWARENGCPWDEDTCSKAADGGHLELLKWCRDNGCPE